MVQICQNDAELLMLEYREVQFVSFESSRFTGTFSYANSSLTVAFNFNEIYLGSKRIIETGMGH